MYKAWLKGAGPGDLETYGFESDAYLTVERCMANFYNKFEDNEKIMTMVSSFKEKKYVLQYVIDKDFYNPTILFGSCLITTDELLDWFDLTDILTDFDIEVITPKYKNIKSYYNLLDDYIGYSKNQLLTHPRKEKYQIWKLTIKNNLLRNPKKIKKNFFGELKNKVLSLLSK